MMCLGPLIFVYPVFLVHRKNPLNVSDNTRRGASDDLEE